MSEALAYCINCMRRAVRRTTKDSVAHHSAPCTVCNSDGHSACQCGYRRKNEHSR